MDGAAEAAEARESFQGDPGYHSLRGLIAARRGDAAEARRRIEQTIRLQSGQRFIEMPIKTASFGHYHHAQYDMACISAMIGDKTDGARLPDAVRGKRLPLLQRSSRAIRSWNLIREEPRFHALIRDLRVECDGYRQIYRQAVSAIDAHRTPHR